MILRQMAFEHIFAAENLSVSEQEFQQEYQAAKRDFEEEQSEYDDGKLQEQVSETLKVSCCILMLLEKNYMHQTYPHCCMQTRPGLQTVSAAYTCMALAWRLDMESLPHDIFMFQ